MWKWIYDANYGGALNGLLMQLGMIDQYQAWLAKPFTAMNLVILADVWHQTPFVVFILLATLSTIPESLYEAARVDGAGSLQAFRKITLPFLRPAFLIVLVIRTMEAFRVFDIIYVMTAGGTSQRYSGCYVLHICRDIPLSEHGQGSCSIVYYLSTHYACVDCIYQTSETG